MPGTRAKRCSPAAAFNPPDETWWFWVETARKGGRGNQIRLQMETKMALTSQQAAALKVLVDAVVGTVKEAGPLGAPGGVIYAALMAHGCLLEQFESLMEALVRLGKVTKRGDCYHAA